MTDTSRPMFLTKNAVKTIIESKDIDTLQDLLPVLQIVSIKNVKNKKNMKDKLTISDGVHKLLCIVKEKINTSADGEYSLYDVIRINKFQIKEVGKVKIIIPSEDFDVVGRDICESIGKPQEYKESSSEDMDIEFEIPYKADPQKTEDDIDMKEIIDEEDKELPDQTPEKEEDSQLQDQTPDKSVEMHGISPSPMKHDIQESSEEKIPQDDMDEPDNADEDDIYTPIKALNTMNSDWIIKARISKKYPEKTWSNNKGNGCLLNFELVDRYGSQITATLFNKAVEKFKDVLEQDKVYVFSKGQVKVANKKFTSIDNDYALHFYPYSDINVAVDDHSISKAVFNFTPLREIQKMGVGKAIDFIGVVGESSQATSFTTKSGDSKEKKDYIMMDNSLDEGLKISVTLWGVQAKKFNFQPGTVVAFKGLRVSLFKGQCLNGGDYTGVFEASKLKLKETTKLSKWYKSVKDNIDSIRSLTETDEASKKNSNLNVRLVSEVCEAVEKDLRNDPTTRYYVNANVEVIKNDPNMVYMACPSCKKKMNHEDGAGSEWRCEKCEMVTKNPVATYLITVKISDSTDSIWVKVYGDSARIVMGNLDPAKFKADYLDQEGDDKTQHIKDKLMAMTFKQFSFSVKPSFSEYSGSQTVSYFANRVFELSHKKSNGFLIDRIKAYEASEQ
jgi:replication factor A1